MNLFKHFCRRYLLTAIVLLTFAWWINGQDLNSGFFDEKYPHNGTHLYNCTIDGVVHYDDDCLNWLAKFLKWIGLGIILIIFLFCGCLWYCVCTISRIFCCSERPREVIYTTYIHPTSYSQMPWFKLKQYLVIKTESDIN